MSVINVVGTTCHPEMEERFNKWYNETHITYAMKSKALKRVTRYKITDAAIGAQGRNELSTTGAKDGYPKYLAVYEFKSSRDFEKFDNSSEVAIARKDWSIKKGEMCAEVFWWIQYESVGTWEQ